MNDFTLRISSAPVRYQSILKEADITAGDREKSGNGLIDTDEEKLAAAKAIYEFNQIYVSELSVQQAEERLRAALLETPHPAGIPVPVMSGSGAVSPHFSMVEAPITAGRKVVVQSNEVTDDSSPATPQSVPQLNLGRLNDLIQSKGHPANAPCPVCLGSRVMVMDPMANAPVIAGK
ncbi:MAG: hypothetical protein LBK68_03835 [Candidatus Margulisbacteria bacterium]|jgi:hypothetical protein|nr:hypothetical protein [Candidatus Margulisiibacteriota bacterium]